MGGNDMKKIIYFAIAILGLVACKTESPSTDKPTRLSVSFDRIKGTSVAVEIQPEDIRAYYYYDVLPVEQYEQLGYSDSHYMMLQLDSLYSDYLIWRYYYLKDNTQYLADFKSHCLYRGTTSFFEGELLPNTDYMVAAFCVNPISMQPLGELQKFYFSTISIDSTTVSPMQIDFLINMFNDEYYRCQISVRPSENGKPSEEPYISYIVSEEELNERFQGDMFNLGMYLLTMLREDRTLFNEWANYDIFRFNAEDYLGLEPGKAYYVLGTPYCYTWFKSIFYRRFVYEPGETLYYGHSRYGEED